MYGPLNVIFYISAIEIGRHGLVYCTIVLFEIFVEGTNENSKNYVTVSGTCLESELTSSEYKLRRDQLSSSIGKVYCEETRFGKVIWIQLAHVLIKRLAMMLVFEYKCTKIK
jgi:hypothetical protein